MDGANMNAQVGFNPATIGADVFLKLTQNFLFLMAVDQGPICVNEKLVLFYQVIH
jgi:glycine cleavage system protein P-like pyridoxal-binding family